MDKTTIVMMLFTSFMLGANLSLWVAEIKYIRPLRKALAESTKGWSKTIDALEASLGVSRKVDGPTVSPIQIDHQD